MEGCRMNIPELQKTLRKFRNERNWEKFHTPQNLAQALVVEAGELSACFLWGAEWRPADRAAVAEECADVLIYLVQLADQFDVDLEKAVRAKIAWNERRFPVQRELEVTDQTSRPSSASRSPDAPR